MNNNVIDNTSVTTRQCSRCYKSKSIYDFYGKDYKAGNQYYWCKECVLNYQMARKRGIPTKKKDIFESKIYEIRKDGTIALSVPAPHELKQNHLKRYKCKHCKQKDAYYLRTKNIDRCPTCLIIKNHSKTI